MPPADQINFLILVIHLGAAPDGLLGVEPVHLHLDKPAGDAKRAGVPSTLKKRVARYAREAHVGSGTHSRLACAAEDVASVALSGGMHRCGKLSNELHLKFVHIRISLGRL